MCVVKTQLFALKLLVTLFHILLGLETVLVSGQCLDDQKSLLLQFKDSLKFNSTLSTKLVSWNQNTDCCTWEGVTCNISNTSHVIGLDINSNSISGCVLNSTSSSLSGLRLQQFPDLRYLPSLITLDLAENQLSGEMPNWIWNVGNGGLRFLNLSVNQLEKLQEPYVIFTSIDISNNQFEGNIPHTIGELKSFKSLNLSHNPLSGSIPNSFGTLKLLETLDLSSNRLTGKIPVELGDISFLAVLDLSDNQLTGRIPTATQIQTFPEASFKGNKKLCGSPFRINCSGIPVIRAAYDNGDPGDNIKWEFVGPEIGFVVGLGVVILPLIFDKGWRSSYYERVDHIIFKVFRTKHQKKNNHGRIRIRYSRIQRARS
ncbi:hypothetical protein POM88_046226 [Heracleum sosnowskyi]|uniref:Leucine-rich repeat-containing N-terminal plant-type domain-containing protein n=1 Tax=Heracleum sosnowskyi TaxID=360622 RepID=A0AAD8H8Y6_9APIA|nr:hypothetical protein POM88_046226 [Heracleum sosnowskyi]